MSVFTGASAFPANLFFVLSCAKLDFNTYGLTTNFHKCFIWQVGGKYREILNIMKNFIFIFQRFLLTCQLLLCSSCLKLKRKIAWKYFRMVPKSFFLRKTKSSLKSLDTSLSWLDLIAVGEFLAHFYINININIYLLESSYTSIYISIFNSD